LEEKITDAQLLLNLKSSDVEAFRVLFDRYQPIIFRHALFMTRETDLSHDIVQETFLRIWENRASLKPELSFLAYALQISGNLVRDNARRGKTRERLSKHVPQPAVSEMDDPFHALQMTMLEEQLMTIIARDLPERCRTIFLLSRFEGKSNREIAEILGLSVKTIEHQISRALDLVRRKLKGYT
jgi:RNA polymerase sigma-70 factor (ECF subfamily)